VSTVWLGNGMQEKGTTRRRKKERLEMRNPKPVKITNTQYIQIVTLIHEDIWDSCNNDSLVISPGDVALLFTGQTSNGTALSPLILRPI
jgi:hypothetical protein